MSQSNCSNELVLLASTLAIALSKGMSSENIGILSGFVVAVGDNLALTASTKESKPCQINIKQCKDQLELKDFS